MSTHVYSFGGGSADGSQEMKNLLGGKGANLAEMASLGIAVPAGFTITTEVCNQYLKQDRVYPESLVDDVAAALKQVENTMGATFGDPDKPLLVSVRSGARQSMPGMMETVLNVGLTTATIPGLIQQTGNERFVYDAYRRLITMYSDVVMEKAQGVEPAEGQAIRAQLEQLLEAKKEERGVTEDTELNADDLKSLVESYKSKVLQVLGQQFPDDPMEQLWGGISAVFQSWNGKRAISYRRIEHIPHEWGTAVNVQAMVFGNMGDGSATGVAFSRNPATGEHAFFGEWLPNAQGEDVVAGIRTPNPLQEASKTEDTQHLPSLEQAMPKIYAELDQTKETLEQHYRDMQDIEFTIQNGTLWLLQTRVGKRNGPAAVRMAVEMCNQGLIGRQEAVMRVRPSQLDELLHPMVDPEEERKTRLVAKGLPAGPGGAIGKIVFTADDAEIWAQRGEQLILVRAETSPEDVHGMHAAEGILTSTGGMTSHAALVARGWGKCCIVGAGELEIDVKNKTLKAGEYVFKEGDWLTLNGSTGRVYPGQLKLVTPDLDKNEHYRQLLEWADEVRELKIRTNADRPEDAAQARRFGAEGIGLCRTEHMFFGPERIRQVRKMIMADSEEDRRAAVMALLPYQKEDFKQILEAMAGFPVTIRLLDPPLHEFIQQDAPQLEALADDLDITVTQLKSRLEALHELNPMLGHRGCRLGISYPEISEMQARAIFEATAELVQAGVEAMPEVMIPLVGHVNEFRNQAEIIRRTAAEVQQSSGVSFTYLVGTMIEIPRACLTASAIAEEADFFSFGTNDLTQMTFGFSRDDIGSFLPLYLDQGILPDDPFQTLDTEGVGSLIRQAVTDGRAVRDELKIGICGEHGGDPASIMFCDSVGLDYVSCSPFRVPIARLAAAQATIEKQQAVPTT